jgi:hypothetical protein
LPDDNTTQLSVAIVGFIFYGALGGVSRAAANPGAFGASLIYCIAAAAGVTVLAQLLPRSEALPTVGSARDRAAA